MDVILVQISVQVTIFIVTCSRRKYYPLSPSPHYTVKVVGFIFSVLLLACDGVFIARAVVIDFLLFKNTFVVVYHIAIAVVNSSGHNFVLPLFIYIGIV